MFSLVQEGKYPICLMDKLWIAWLEMRTATVMLQLKIPRWRYGIKHRGKPCMNCTEISLQWDAFLIIMLAKMSRRIPSKLLSNHSFPYLRFTPKAFPPPRTWSTLTIHFSVVVTGHKKAPVLCTTPLSLPCTLNSTAYSPGGLQTQLRG